MTPAPGDTSTSPAPIELGDIGEALSAARAPEDREKTARLLADLEVHRQRADLEAKRLDNDLRRSYCERLFQLLAGWLAFVALFVACASYKDSIFEASDAVILALLGTTTANVIGVYLVVAKWLFPTRKGQDN